MNATAMSPADTSRTVFSVRAGVKAALLWVLWSWVPQPVCSALDRRTKRMRVWLWATRIRRAVVRTVVGWHLIGTVAVIAALPAHAEDGSRSPENRYFNFMPVKDSHGISVWRYYLSIDEGSARHPTYMAYSIIIQIQFEIYRAISGAAIWFITWSMSFDWLPKIVAPVRTLGDAVTSITGQFNLTTTFLTVTAGVVAIWIIRGRWSTGIYELMISCAIAALAVGVLSNPIERIAGQDGLIMQGRDAGLQIASGLANDGDMNSSPDEMINDIGAGLADSFIRQPTQLLNFGTVIDTDPSAGADCIEAWDSAHEDKKGNDKDTLKDNIADCDGSGAKDMKDYADNPGPSQVIGGLILVPGSSIIMLFAFLFAGAMLMAAAAALGSAVKAIPALVIGILPGAGRGSLLKTASTVIMSVVIMVFAVVFVAAYLLVVRSFFNTESGGLMEKFVFVDIVLLVGLVMFRRGVKRLRKLSDTLAQKMATRPGAAPTAISKSTPVASPMQNAAAAAQVGRQVYQGGKTLAKHGATAARHGATAAKATGAAAQTAGAATGTAATGGVAAAYFVGKAAVAGVKAVKNKRAAGKDVDQTAKSETKGKDTTATAAAIAAGQKGKDAAKSAVSTATAAAASKVTGVPVSTGAPRPRRDQVAKPGIKKPVSNAPVSAATRPARGDRGGATPKTTNVGRETFREYRTSNGSPILLPEPKKTSARRTSEKPASTSQSSAVPRVSPSTARPQPSELVRPSRHSAG